MEHLHQQFPPFHEGHVIFSGYDGTDSDKFYLFKNSFNFVDESLGAQCLDFVLFESVTLMIQRLQMVFFILFLPSFVEGSLIFSPFFIFCF